MAFSISYLLYTQVTNLAVMAGIRLNGSEDLLRRHYEDLRSLGGFLQDRKLNELLEIAYNRLKNRHVPALESPMPISPPRASAEKNAASAIDGCHSTLSLAQQIEEIRSERSIALDAEETKALNILAGIIGSRFPEEIPIFYPEVSRNDCVSSDVLPWVPPSEMQRGFAVVTCSMNRTENLIRAIPSWLMHDKIDEIVVVDWSSDADVKLALREAGVNDERIKVIRVDDESRWVLSYAYNVGFRCVCYGTVIKLDADFVLSDDFFEKNKIPREGEFVAGNWRNAQTGQEHVNGFFMVPYEDLYSVGGFNELITTYGWDDDDLFGRLQSSGISRYDVESSTIWHLDHTDEERVADYDSSSISLGDQVCRTPGFMIQRNRRLSAAMSEWGRDAVPEAFYWSGGGPEGGRLKRVNGSGWQTPDAAFSWATRSEFVARLRRDGHLTHACKYPLNLDLLSCLPGEKLKDRDSNQYSAERFLREFLSEKGSLVGEAKHTSVYMSKRKPKMFIDAQHGLGNRLRAIGSAAAIAEATDRELVIVWQPDEHCDCRFCDLFAYHGAVVEESFLHEPGNCDVHNYMAVEGGEKGAPIRSNGTRDIYARSAFVLNSPHSDWERENHFIRSLQPVEAVQALVNSVRHPNDIAVHVRMEGGRKDEHLPYESSANWTAEDHDLIDYWRARSHLSHFMARLDTLIADGRADRIFIAADLPETYEEFRRAYGDRLAWLKRSLYDRSAQQLQHALADALLLSRAPLLLGSTWSSFSEVAQRLSPGGMKVEMSGKDF